VRKCHEGALPWAELTRVLTAEKGDSIDRKQYGALRAAYWTILGGHSPECAPGDSRAATAFVARIETAIDQGGWTRNEWRNLKQLWARWTRRAAGEDLRFNLVGTRGGRLDRDEEARIRERTRIYNTAEWHRTAQPLQYVAASDGKLRPSAGALRSRRYTRRLDDQQDGDD
jgi:hypothetical protein